MNKLAYTLLAIGLSGCVTSPQGTVWHVDDPFQFFSYAGSRGAIPVMVVGDPYPGRRAAVESVALAAFDHNFKSLGNPFRTMPAAPGAGTKIVLTFNATQQSLPEVICRDPSKIATGPSGGRMTVNALYCGDGPYSEYQVSFDTPASPDSGAFKQMLDSVAYHAVPREISPQRRTDGQVPPI